MTWLLLSEIFYFIILVLVCLRIIYDSRSNVKTLAYLLLVIFLPVFGIFFYFSFGINYQKRKIYSKKLIEDEDLRKKLQDEIFQYSKNTLEQGTPEVQSSKELAVLLFRDITSPLTGDNKVKVLINGENKFPEVLDAMGKAKDHIHIEYYIVAFFQLLFNRSLQCAVEAVFVHFFVFQELIVGDALLELFGREEVVFHSVLFGAARRTACGRDGERKVQVLCHQVVDDGRFS